jgi:hypothetical protein
MSTNHCKREVDSRLVTRTYHGPTLGDYYPTKSDHWLPGVGSLVGLPFCPFPGVVPVARALSLFETLIGVSFQDFFDSPFEPIR